MRFEVSEGESGDRTDRSDRTNGTEIEEGIAEAISDLRVETSEGEAGAAVFGARGAEWLGSLLRYSRSIAARASAS